jgi:probable addiction module antidote protein
MREFDPVEYMQTEEGIAAYLKAAAKSDDEEYFIDCLRDVTRAREINRLALETGVDRKIIYDMLTVSESDDEPATPDPIVVAKIKATFGLLEPAHV